MSFDNNQFDNMFLKEPGTPTGNVYDIYVSAAKELWERYSDKYELRPRSLANAKKGTNRGIELYKGGKHYLGVSVGKTTTIYAFDEYFRNRSKLEYNQDNRGQYRYTFDSFEECIDSIGNLL